jgi:DNA-binding NtrC family response regulator
MERLPLLGHLAREGKRVIAISTAADTKTAVRAVKNGAADFLRKGCPLSELKGSIGALAALGARGSAACPAEQPCSCPFTGSSLAIRKVAALVNLYARSDFPVLILGESGTGKELAARALHELSARKAGSFVARNCAALPELLAESELFGSERGAFTDAVARPGAFELARGGVLFLDEIGDAGPALQAKLLRALETGEIWRLGGGKPIAIDARLVTATARDLRSTATRGAFRPDLLYRIDTLVLKLPPLRERREDIPDLASYFSLKASAGRTVPGSAALAKLSAYDWPGNIRQLRNVIHRALVLAEDTEELGEKHIVFY